MNSNKNNRSNFHNAINKTSPEITELGTTVLARKPTRGKSSKKNHSPVPPQRRAPLDYRYLSLIFCIAVPPLGIIAFVLAWKSMKTVDQDFDKAWHFSHWALICIELSIGFIIMALLSLTVVMISSELNMTYYGISNNSSDIDLHTTVPPLLAGVAHRKYFDSKQISEDTIAYMKKSVAKGSKTKMKGSEVNISRSETIPEHHEEPRRVQINPLHQDELDKRMKDSDQKEKPNLGKKIMPSKGFGNHDEGEDLSKILSPTH